jgi:hypothetical protein
MPADPPPTWIMLIASYEAPSRFFLRKSLRPHSREPIERTVSIAIFLESMFTILLVPKKISKNGMKRGRYARPVRS